MSDSFLEEQVRRIKQLTERMAQVTNRTATNEGAREHHTAHGPLHDVRDVRIIRGPERKTTASDSSSRRSRRRRR